MIGFDPKTRQPTDPRRPKPMSPLHRTITLTTLLHGALAMPNPQNTALPQTLFEMVGAVQPEPSWKNSVLIIIDAQKEYETGRLVLPGVKSATRVIGRLLSDARTLGVPVIHVLHEGENGLFDPSEEGFKSIEALKPLKDEIVIRKSLPDSFAGTELQKILSRVANGKKLVITGFMTHMCITATAVSALNLGYESFVIQDGVATRDLKGADGKVISDQDMNESALAALRDRIAWVISSSKLSGMSGNN